MVLAPAGSLPKKVSSLALSLRLTTGISLRVPEAAPPDTTFFPEPALTENGFQFYKDVFPNKNCEKGILSSSGSLVFYVNHLCVCCHHAPGGTMRP
ncbi:MAG: hypothetical protein LBF22_03945 [Deltaproteobacteria bacterium]|nr:hypothetical protein [Deltaproteobacteria bacterium]